MSAPRPHKRQCPNQAEPLLALPSEIWEIVCALVSDNPRWLFATWSLVCPLASRVARPVRFATLCLDSDGAAVPAARWQEWQEITQLTLTGQSTGRVLRAVRAGRTRVRTLLLGKVTARLLGEAVHIRGLRGLGCGSPEYQESDSEPTLVPYADWLDVSYQEVDDDALALYLRARRASLRTLVLEQRQVSPGLCEALGGCTELRQLKVQFCSFAAFGWLAALPALQSLDLTHCTPVTDAVLELLSVLRKLEQLSLQHCDEVTMAGLASLASLCHLRYLDLGYVSRLASPSFLAGLPELSKLHVNNCNLNNAALATLSSCCRQLQVLDLSGNDGLTDAGLGPLSALYQLTVLHLNFCHGIRGGGLTCLAGLSELRSLSLQGCLALTNLGARPLPPKLQSLIFCESLRDEALLPVAHLAQLRELDLTGCRLLTEVGLQHLAGLYSLQKLNLFFCSGLRDFKFLSELRSLTQLSLQGCTITASQLAHLPPNLQRLDLSSNQSLTDEAFHYLASLAKLRTLRIEGCPALTQGAVLGFKARRPSVLIH